ncbi:MAG: prepilin-type N-terminal cleavage/methylation domain-containing protein [Acidobacteria bacterium]|nr:prepilin-type N-terminal cleavage/methylation domain-containing protein [Acidobacteriota bacterium]MBV9146525.1 prepilin-type N-terminal cleavage/methylation domain-containing protein [Acidobacteriota bacterium]MBV9435455.1 prepilin-type N-terminal cleavage/methylation domain-containing protein [Acidobacteriota bacterium]
MKSRRRRAQQGFTLIELLVAMIILTVGMLGGAAIIAVAIASNANSRMDTGAVALAQSTMDRILVISESNPLPTDMTDCKGNVHAISTAIGGAATTNIAGIGTGTQVIDFTQAAAGGYQMTYTLCAQGGAGYLGVDQVYDVRWNVSQGPTQNTQLVLVAAKNVTEQGNGLSQTKYFSIPITLRALRGN